MDGQKNVGVVGTALKTESGLRIVIDRVVYDQMAVRRIAMDEIKATIDRPAEKADNGLTGTFYYGAPQNDLVLRVEAFLSGMDCVVTQVVRREV